MLLMKFDWLIVGCGFTGATAARQLAEQHGMKVLVVDRRDHVAGNAYDYVDSNGLLVHRYGPHIFHTNSAKVFSFLSRFTEWTVYFHRVKGMVGGCYVPLPFNLNSVSALFPAGAADRLCGALISEYGYGARIPVLKLRDSKSHELKDIAAFVYENVFLNYTKKQWDLLPDELDPGVTARVPIVLNRDDRYFSDKYQAMPTQGYTALFGNMLDHPNISVQLGADWTDLKGKALSDRVIFTGPIDEFFDHRCGELPYRSVRFEMKSEINAEFLNECTTINFPNAFDFTRVTLQHRLTGQRGNAQLSVYEYPCRYMREANEPYYPIPAPPNQVLLQRYRELSATLAGSVFFAGRLGDYQYYNMDQACARGMALVEKEIPQAMGGHSNSISIQDARLRTMV
jgi:UDP-galactopyranose mutase